MANVFHDHILRGEEAPADVGWYIWLNPVRARLAQKVTDYPYSGPLLPEEFPPREVGWSPPGKDRS